MKAQVRQVYIWLCPYKKCSYNNENEDIEKLKNGKYGVICENCGRVIEIEL